MVDSEIQNNLIQHELDKLKEEFAVEKSRFESE